jgi:hypothetical protein
MSEIRYTLLCDGSSDKALIPIINWTIQQHSPETEPEPVWADFSSVIEPPKAGNLSARIRTAVDNYPCDWLFVHRDAEKELPAARHQEIDSAWRQVEPDNPALQIVRIIPVRMTEAWLLIDKQAIRKAAANPNGRQSISLPALRNIEDHPDPKQLLAELLRQASGLTGRRLEKFIRHERQAIQIVAEEIEDFSPLRALPAFRMFEDTVKNLLTTIPTSP